MIEHDVTDELHRTACAECRGVWADLERISAEARALPTLTPTRDLWAGIESRLDRAAGASSARPERARTHWMPRAWLGVPALRLATAASLLVAATASLTWWATTRGEGAPSPVAAIGGPADPGPAATAPATPVSLAGDFGQMDREIAELQRMVAERRAELDPATLAVLERNLALIDQAIAESRTALAGDPASRFLVTQLARSYGSKLTLLRGIATLPAGT
ncbi:MAG: hypothetical protein JNL44_04605 [Gemmatimonadetes bacterium]|nr:hypothetical protein [Gemmatimonadota bacterium]